MKLLNIMEQRKTPSNVYNTYVSTQSSGSLKVNRAFLSCGKPSSLFALSFLCCIGPSSPFSLSFNVRCVSSTYGAGTSGSNEKEVSASADGDVVIILGGDTTDLAVSCCSVIELNRKIRYCTYSKTLIGIHQFKGSKQYVYRNITPAPLEVALA